MSGGGEIFCVKCRLCVVLTSDHRSFFHFYDMVIKVTWCLRHKLKANSTQVLLVHHNTSEY